MHEGTQSCGIWKTTCWNCRIETGRAAMVLAAMVRTATTATTATTAATAATAATEGKQNPTTVCTAEKEAAQHRPGRCWPMLLLLQHLYEKESFFVPKKKYANAG